MAAIIARNATTYHDAEIYQEVKYLTFRADTRFTYSFQNFFHPRVGELLARLNRRSLPGVMDAVWQERPRLARPQQDSPPSGLTEHFFQAAYDPTPNGDLIRVEYFPKEIDVSPHGPYANYNWELFFHIPLTIATHLSKTQRFAEAQKWFHYIFDPTFHDDDRAGPAPAPDVPRVPYWKFLAFRKPGGVKTMDEVLRLLSLSNPTGADVAAQREAMAGYAAILDKPFMPHVVARTRPTAYRYHVVMKYLDNLIAWGDHLFQQDTMESINEATMRYVAATNILGPHPQRIPPRGKVKAKTYRQLKNQGIGPIGNALVDLEGQFPFNLASGSSVGDSASAHALFGIGRTLYFCLPRNQKLLSYWDTVADRLFKIRHCMNIEGVVRPLALFDPPIDPGMLVKAAAAGLDIGGIISGLNKPIGPVRSQTLIQKALELTSEVRSLGAALLSALEKGDAERLTLLRQGHEIQIQKLTKEVRFLQSKAAQEATKSLVTARATALERLRNYQRLLGLPADPNAPDTLAIDQRPLTEENFEEAFGALVAQYDKPLTRQNLPALRLAGENSPGQQSGESGPGQLFLNVAEDSELNTHLPLARDTRLTASIAETVASVLTFIPEFDINLHFWGLGGSSNVFGGSKLSDATKIGAEVLRTISAHAQDQAGMSSRTAGHQRRADDWILQYNLAAHEIMQNGRQLLTSLIAEQIAAHEYDNVVQQIANANEINEFLQEKFTQEDLYLWMQGEISRLYYEYYRFAFDTARRAERTVKQEVMRPELDSQDFVKFNYWDGGRKGLLSGEALHLDLKRLEMASLDNNKREIELTRHISLRQLDPVALLNLRTRGHCTVTIPEWLYDRDCPGHYMRRIKSVAVSLPSVTGPYTSVNCTLTLQKSWLRKSPLATSQDDYPRQPGDDDRFVQYNAVQSVVTSGGSNDGGQFETNLRDERFLPFEGAGAESEWQISLPTDFRAFDYMSLSDVILHVRYTARQGIPAGIVTGAVADLFAAANGASLALLFSLRHDFPNEWAAFLNSATADFSAVIRQEYFPYFAQSTASPTPRSVHISGIEAFAPNASAMALTSTTIGNQPIWDTLSGDLNNVLGERNFTVSSPPIAGILTRDAHTQPFLVVRYTLA